MSSLAPAVLKLSWLFTASFGAYALSLVVLQRTMVPSGGLTRGKARRGACTALRVGQALGLDLKRVLELPQVSERRLPFERLRAISWMVLPDQVSSKPRAVQNALTSRDVCSSHGEFLADVEVVGEKHAPNGSVVARAGPVDAGSPKHAPSGSNMAGTGFGSRRPHRPERGQLPTGERPVGKLVKPMQARANSSPATDDEVAQSVGKLLTVRTESELPMDGVCKAQRAGIDIDVLEDDEFAGGRVSKIRRGNEEDRSGKQPPEPSDDCS